MSERPKIFISTTDAEKLEKLLASLSSASLIGCAELENELARATIVPPEEMPSTVVTMNSTVRFTVKSTNEDFELTLVYPKDASLEGKKISILAPVGSALLGLSQGDEIAWPKPGGGLIEVRVKEVLYQPERSGAYHR